jgi:micrococcal nuclease
MKTLVFLLVGLAVSHGMHANDVFSGKVAKVIDGNTLEVVATDSTTYKIMLYGIDSPELGQEYGEQAKHFLEKLLLGKSVTVNVKGKDRLGTRLGVVVAQGDVDPRYEMLKKGLAWTREINPDAELEALKDQAREKGNGLWKDGNPTPPWTFRRQQTMAQIKSS